jgi:hypothetical protein
MKTLVVSADLREDLFKGLEINEAAYKNLSHRMAYSTTVYSEHIDHLLAQIEWNCSKYLNQISNKNIICSVIEVKETSTGTFEGLIEILDLEKDVFYTMTFQAGVEDTIVFEALFTQAPTMSTTV